MLSSNLHLDEQSHIDVHAGLHADVVSLVTERGEVTVFLRGDALDRLFAALAAYRDEKSLAAAADQSMTPAWLEADNVTGP